MMTDDRPQSVHPVSSGLSSAIEVAGLSFRYDSGTNQDRVWTLQDLSFQVDAGEILGIVGPNGSGKSSLLKLLAGLLRAGEGEIRLGGILASNRYRVEIAKLVALVPQEHVQVFPFTVAETVLMGRFPHRKVQWWSMGIGDESPQDLTSVQRAMAETDVLSLADRMVSDLSGGERQRVMIARALAQEPAILLLDEPTSFLDINHQLDICSLIARLRAERRLTVVLVSHDLNIASQYCDRLLILKEGRLSWLGTPSDTIRPEILRMVYGCDVVVDAHPQTGRPRVTMPAGKV